MKDKEILATMLILAFVVRIASAAITPSFDKPDERPHFEYMQFIVENKRLPVQESQGGEFFQPPFYHVMASFVLAFARIFTENTGYLVFSMRLMSIIVSMFTLYFIYKISSLVFSNRHIALGSVAFASFLPSYVNINSTVTNANFGDFLTTLVIYLLLIVLIKKEGKNTILLLGLIAGISMITRISMIPVLLAVPLAFIAKYYPNIKANINKIIKPLVLIAVIALLISSWNFIRNYGLYGDFLGVNAMQLSSPPDDIAVDAMFIGRLLGWTFVTFWAAFGRTNGIFIGNLESSTGIIVFSLAYLLLLAVTLAAVYGIFAFIRKYRKNEGILDKIQKKYFLIALFHLALLFVLFMRFNLYDFQPQGRLFFPGISTIAVLFTFGIYNVFREKYWKKAFNAYIAFFALLSIASIASILVHYA